MAEVALIRTAPLPDRAVLLRGGAARPRGLPAWRQCPRRAAAGALAGHAHPLARRSTCRRLMVRDALLPRFAASLLTGAALGLAGVLFQQVLRNPLAEPGTLGVFAGAKCAAGGGHAVGARSARARLGRHRLAGRLRGDGDRPAARRAAGLRAAAADPLRPHPVAQPRLARLDADGDPFRRRERPLHLGGGIAGAEWLERRFGTAAAGSPSRAGSAPCCGGASRCSISKRTAPAASACHWRRRGSAASSLAVALSATVAGLVGLISFIGLAGPAIARLAGARRFRDRLIAAPLLGAALLAVTDQALDPCLRRGRDPGRRGLRPVGRALADLAGAPGAAAPMTRPARPAMRARSMAASSSAAAIRRRLLLALAICAAVLILALVLGRVPEGWHLAWGEEFQALLPWRLPRPWPRARPG